MRNQKVYSSKNVVSLVVVFLILFWLLYSIGSFLHQSKKVNDEIERISQTNKKIREEIQTKKKTLQYLKTPQRIEKEAKMQMGRKRPGEKVLVFIEEKLDLIPPGQSLRQRKNMERITPLEKWKWVFLGER